MGRWAQLPRTEPPWRPGPGPCRLPLSGLVSTEKPNLFGSALRPSLPSPTPFQRLKGPFLFAEPKEAGCQGDRSRNSGEPAMGEGLCPQTAVSRSSPSWDQSLCLLREDTFPSALLPVRPLRRPLQVSTGSFPWGQPASQPASSKMLQYQTKNRSVLPPPPLACTHALIVPLAVG